MYIKSVIIDGFKSYGRRTEINGFDPEFTAITGLNGTGKSNILDSICFVLGISNLNHVRAGSLQELVYKNGQAGITKATVTLIFDNTDPNQCPLGYDKCREISVTRQIVVGGKNKYLINGKLVQNKKVVDFFCSVQLNVNNPNFLIMQGRITKVLNMKPQEILSIIEEAAGTSMYESKREATNKLIEKKELRVRETNDLLIEDVEPKLEKLRQERTVYMEYQKITREIDYLTRIHISGRYLKYKEAVKSIETSIEKLTNRVEECRTTITENEEECSRIDENARNMQEKIDTESGGALKTLESELSTKMTAEASDMGSLKAAQGSIAQEEKKLRTLEKDIVSDGNTLEKKQTDMAKVEGLFQSLKEADEHDAKAYEAAQRNYEAVMKGLTTNEDGQATTLEDQLRTAKQQASEAQTTITTSDNELRMKRGKLKQLEGETQTNDAAYVKDKSLLDQLTQEIKKVETQMQHIGYEDGKFEMLEQRRNVLHQEMRQLKRGLDQRNAKYDLQYQDPTPNFDRRKVHGIVGKLFDVLDPNNSMALSTCGGGHLRSYVTDDDVTSKLILDRGRLQRRVTMIPINKIRSYPIDRRTVDFAQRLVGKENVQWALDLISYDKYFTPVMQFVFGHILICRDIHIAKQVAFHQNIKCLCVTLDGDVVDPKGTMSGGSRIPGQNAIEELTMIKDQERQMARYRNELQQIEEEIHSLESLARSYNKCKETLELRHHELKACQSRLATTSFQQHQEEINTLKEEIQHLEEKLLQARETQKTARAKVKDIEEKRADADGYRKREQKAATEKMQTAKKQSEKSHNEWKKRELEYSTFQLEIEELRKSIETATKQRDELTETLAKMKTDLEDLRTNSAAAAEKIAELKQRIKEQKDKISAQNKEMKSLYVRKDKLQKQNQELTLEIKKKENEVNKIRNDSKDSLKKIENLEKNYTWILEERDCFGIKNTRYDYSKEDPVEAGNKLAKMREVKEKMERNINKNAMVTLDREEEQYKETMRRKRIVEQDKEKIRHIIVRMDEKKREQVDKAWKEVNENFGSIFGTLLQGAQAALNPVMQKNHLLGLEIKVGFNGVWKDSLGELSGGQRSLVALSLVLAMLKFSPAPLYILDEVDAALDMSHTQNIGNMLKKHFTSSQFIIVSLKDGMFNNANVLFRTKFDDGVSAVTRTVSAKNMQRNK